MNDRDGETSKRLHLGVILLLVVAWQAHAAWLAWRVVPQFGALLSGLGAELPMPTQLVLSTYRAWGVIPVATAVLAIDLLRRRDPSLAHSMFVLLVGAAVGLLMQIGLVDSMLFPFLDVLGKVG